MNTQLIVKLRKILNTGFRLSLVCVLTIATNTVFAAGRVSSNALDSKHSGNAIPQVGQVSLLLGKAFVETAENGRETLRVGSAIQVGDLITTTSNGHVHIQFTDKAYLSLRPNSRLSIIRYDFNEEHPELSSIKFDLKEGVTRSISGQAAKSAREQFRLNTPIAAIGVRGTDFVVSTTGDTVRALVNEGLIVMAPFSDACSADSYGPCRENAVELAAQSMQILQLDGIASVPQLLPAPLRSDQSALQSEAILASVDTTNANDNRSTKQEELSERAILTRIATGAETVANQQPKPSQPEPPQKPKPDPQPPVVPQIPDFTPQAPITVSDVNQRQLVWGRYSYSDSDKDRISLSIAEASTNRAVSVGNFEYGLFRTNNDSQKLDKGLGVISFQLNSAQAFYDSGSGVVAMKVSGGNLAIDFQQSNFSTTLNLEHALTGSIDFFASGGLFDGGHFHSRNDLQRIAGSVSFDGKEAGYFFEKQLQTGNINGLTLWDSKK